MSKKLIIDRCNDCNHLERVCKYVYTCNKSKKDITIDRRRSEEPKIEIPHWCELEDE